MLPQVDAALVAYVATLLDYAKAWQNVVPGATLAAPLAPNVISTLAAHLSTELDVRDDPIMCTARMQVRARKGERACSWQRSCESIESRCGLYPPWPTLLPRRLHRS